MASPSQRRSPATTNAAVAKAQRTHPITTRCFAKGVKGGARWLSVRSFPSPLDASLAVFAARNYDVPKIARARARRCARTLVATVNT